MDSPTSKITQKDFETVGFPTAFARADGHTAEIDLDSRTPKDFDFRKDPLRGKANALTMTDCLPLM